MSERTLWMVRHGIRQDMLDVTWSAGRERPYDTPLAEQGRQQAAEMGERLLAEKIDHVFSSPFTRAMQTASAIAIALGQTIKVDPALSEALYPDWFPSDPDIGGQLALAREFGRADPSYEPRAPVSYSESGEELRARMRGLVEDLLDRFEGNLLLVGHGGSIRGLCLELAGEDRPIHACCCCLIEVGRNGNDWEIRRDGADKSHLSITEESLH